MSASHTIAATLLIISGSLTAVGTKAAAEPPESVDHFRRGTAAFNLGHYLEAVKEYEAAYVAREDPSLLFNIAQAYRLAGKHEEAIRVYKSFLHAVPGTPERSLVERRIAELQQLLEGERNSREAPPQGTMSSAAAPAPAMAQTATPTASPPLPPMPAVHARSARALTVAGLVAAGLGIGSLASGLGLEVEAHQVSDEQSRATRMMQAYNPARDATGRTDQTAGAVLLAFGGVASATGAVLFLVGRHRRLQIESPRLARAAVSR
jgi:tetratricopeptide (TPR) repeat protein